MNSDFVSCSRSFFHVWSGGWGYISTSELYRKMKFRKAFYLALISGS